MQFISESLDRIGGLVNQKYEICKKIGSGSFGTLYEGKDIITQQKVAIKTINRKRNDRTTIGREIRIYRKYLKNNKELNGIPTLHWFGTDHHLGDVMVMDLLGPDLEKVFRLCNKKFSLKTVIMIAIQMLERLKTVHNLSIIHRDLKPENFLLGTESDSKYIYIIDFGLSKSYIDRETRTHFEFRANVGMTGTARYCSINTQSGNEQSRRDDLESIAYILSYFYFGSLPWQGLKVRNSLKSKTILRIKQTTGADNLFKGLDPVFKEYLIYCKQLGFKEKPDYELWINRFQEIYDRMDFGGLDGDNKYDWNLFYDKLDLN